MQISLNGCLQSTGLTTRMIWQELFNIYLATGGPVAKMDNMLIDYTEIKEHLDNGVEDLYWRHTGWSTWLSTERADHDYHININDGVITITCCS